MSFATSVYNTFFRRNAVYLTSIFVGAFAFEMAFDTVSDRVWDSMNQGRQWKDIKHKYMKAGGGGDDDDDE